MTEFMNTLLNPDIAFLRYALLAGILSSITFGIIGTYVVTRRISYIAGAIAHSVLAGIGISLFLQYTYGIEWITPTRGAVCSALIAAIIIGYISINAKEREDTIIGTVWAIGMALGLLFIAKTPAYIDPMSYLFGNILLISKIDLSLISLFGLLVVILCFIFYHQFLGICFDEEFSQVRGLKVKALYFLLLCLTALTTILMVRLVGIVLVIALLTIPAAIASLFSRKLWQMMILAILFCMLSNTSGLVISFTYDLPTGPTIIAIAGITYIISLAVHTIRKRLI